MIIPAIMSGKTVAVLGLGRSGLSAVRALAMAGARVYAHDDHTAPQLPEGVQASSPEDWPWDELAVLVISPGIPHAFPEPHPAAAMATARGIPIISDIELMMLARPEARIVGITGTNGKSTTTMLISHLLGACGITAIAGGNIGTPVLELEDPGPDGVIVLELSSYQLEITPSLALDAGAVINITPDHLDRHFGWGGYVAAKARLAEAIRKTGLLVLGRGAELDPLIGFCSGESQRIDQGDAPLFINNPALTGPHNIENTAIAFRLGAYLGGDRQVVESALPQFRGLPHRMEPVCTHDGIHFVNDSKATNAEAAEKALRSFSSIYWIAGGEAKDGGISGITHALSNVVRAYLIGASADDFAHDLGGSIPHRISGTVEQALADAIADASADHLPDATILLAPAAASFDQFRNFEARGDAFRAAALNWAEETMPRDTTNGEAMNV